LLVTRGKEPVEIALVECIHPSPKDLDVLLRHVAPNFQLSRLSRLAGLSKATPAAAPP
jgi:hypothetical protein